MSNDSFELTTHEENEANELRIQLAETRKDLARMRRDLTRSNTALAEIKAYTRMLEVAYSNILSSTSWRALEPIRATVRQLRGQRKAPILQPRPSLQRLDGTPPRTPRTHRLSQVTKPDDIVALRGLLWGGQSDYGRSGLEAISQNAADESTRARAAMELAVWYDFNNDPERALALLDAMDSMSEDFALSARRQMLRGFLNIRMCQNETAKSILESIPENKQNANVRLALSNVAESDQERLAQINEVLEAKGLTPIRLSDQELPLSLDNIEGYQTNCNLPDIGLVSVVVPAYCARDSIETAIRSICNQTYTNLEIIVVDDHSPDDTFDVVAQLAESDSRITPVRQPKNSGAYPARNRGLAAARGDFITTHDADDWSHPQKIESQLRWLYERPELVGVSSYWSRVTEDLYFTTNWRLSKDVIHWNHSSFLFRREVSDLLGGWDNVRVSADTEFIWRVEAAYGVESMRHIMSYVPLSFGRDDESSLTRTKASHISTIYFGLRQYYREISRYWHEQAPDGLSEEQMQRKMAMIPIEMVHREAKPQEVEIHLVGDCADPSCIESMKHLAEGYASVGVSHLPKPRTDFRRDHNGHQFHNDFFDFIQTAGVRIVLLERGPLPETVVNVNSTVEAQSQRT